MQDIINFVPKGQGENVKAIKHCLAYLSREAKEAGLEELAQLIDMAALAAADITVRALH